MRIPRPVTALALAAALLGGAATLSGCSLIRDTVDQASGGSVDIGGKSVPADYPKDVVPLTTGDVIYGAKVTTSEGTAWNVTISVSGREAMQQITTQLTGAGLTATASAGSDATGDTATFTKDPYTVIVVVTQPATGDQKGKWVANYTVTKASPSASPSPSSSATP